MYSRRAPHPLAFEVVGPKPLDAQQARDLLYLAATLRRWYRVLHAAGGDREHALRVWREAGRAELAEARRQDELVQRAVELWHEDGSAA